MFVFWDVTPWHLVEVYRCFRRTCHLLHLGRKWKQQVPL